MLTRYGDRPNRRMQTSVSSRTQLQGYDAYDADSPAASDVSQSCNMRDACLEAVRTSATFGHVAAGCTIDGGDTCAVPMSEASTAASSPRPLRLTAAPSPPSSTDDDAGAPDNPLFETAERDRGVASLSAVAALEQHDVLRQHSPERRPPRPPPSRCVTAATQTPPSPPPPRLNAFRSSDSVSIVHSASVVSTAALPPPEMLPTFVSRIEHVTPSRDTISAPAAPGGGADVTRGAAQTLMRPDAAPDARDGAIDAQFPPRFRDRMAARDAAAPQFATSYTPPAPLGRRASDPWLFSNKRRGASSSASPKKRISGYARSSSMPHIAGATPRLLRPPCVPMCRASHGLHVPFLYAGSAPVHIAAQTSHLALMRRAPSRHVWSSSLASESSVSDALPDGPASLNNGFPSALLAPPGVYDNIPEEEEVAVFFEPNSAQLTRTLPDAGMVTPAGGTTVDLSESSRAFSLGSPLRESDEEGVESLAEHSGLVTLQAADTEAGPMPESARQPNYGSPARILSTGAPSRGQPAHVARGAAQAERDGSRSMRGSDAGMPQPPPRWHTQPPPPMVRSRPARIRRIYHCSRCTATPDHKLVGSRYVDSSQLRAGRLCRAGLRPLQGARRVVSGDREAARMHAL